ncbi:hypothetical protein JY504_08140 [Corynebacterium amycolatum]|jgi:hypothetical protein|nr:hypothetical protein [Corynebacterium amycolatum]MCQ9125585.1 hypothetical protein [Corynebacterium amycolatum]MCQ9169988.1 hypothetical protein [Corynebacterium amycolatum]MCQ9177005.1 hypothetical protein [Corynebacterium amycolatum]
METIRNFIPASARATWYAVASALVAALVSWGMLDDAAAPAVTGVVIAVITLMFALLHSTSPWRQALYGVASAVSVLGVYLGWGTEAQFDSILMIIAPVLAIGTAAATTNAGEYVGEHRLGE